MTHLNALSDSEVTQLRDRLLRLHSDRTLLILVEQLQDAGFTFALPMIKSIVEKGLKMSREERREITKAFADHCAIAGTFEM